MEVKPIPPKFTLPIKGAKYVSYANNEGAIYWWKNKDRKWYIAIGVVENIEHFSRYDIIYVNFNRHAQYQKPKKIFAKVSLARKQVPTLRLGEYTMVFGECNRDRTDYIAEVFFPSFVPTAFDLKNIDEQIDPTKCEEEEQLDLIDLINEKEKKL